MDRREFTDGLARAGLVLFSGLGFRGNESAPPTADQREVGDPQRDVARAANEAVDTSASIDLMENQTIPLLKFQLLDRPFVATQPDGLDMDQQEFARFSASLKPEFEKFIGGKRESFANDHGKLYRMLLGFLGYLEDKYPKVSNQLKNFREKSFFKLPPVEAVFAAITLLNRYLFGAGFFINYGNMGGRKPGLAIYNIGEKSGHVEVDDDGEKYSAPYINVDFSHPFASAGEILPSDLNGVYDHVFDLILIGQSTDAWAKKISQGLALSPQDAAVFAETFGDDVLRHEATHAFLQKRFPRAHSLEERRFATDVRYRAGGAIRGFSDEPFTATYYSELASVGMELANSSSKAKLVWGIKEDEAQQYELAHMFMRIAAASLLRNADDRMAIIKSLEHGDVNLKLLEDAVRRPDFTLEDSRKVGEIMYRMGFELTRRAHNGEFAVVR